MTSTRGGLVKRSQAAGQWAAASKLESSLVSELEDGTQSWPCHLLAAREANPFPFQTSETGAQPTPALRRTPQGHLTSVLRNLSFKRCSLPGPNTDNSRTPTKDREGRMLQKWETVLPAGLALVQFSGGTREPRRALPRAALGSGAYLG